MVVLRKPPQHYPKGVLQTLQHADAGYKHVAAAQTDDPQTASWIPETPRDTDDTANPVGRRPELAEITGAPRGFPEAPGT